MKLSDAAVLGAATWERVCYPVQDADEAKKKGCFLQLALRAVGFSAAEVSDGINWAKLTPQEWPWTKQPSAQFLVSHASRIWNMNDNGMPFEEILDYVRQQEPSEEALIEQDHKEVLASAIQREKAAVEESFSRMEENELEMRAGTSGLDYELSEDDWRTIIER